MKLYGWYTACKGSCWVLAYKRKKEAHVKHFTSHSFCCHTAKQHSACRLIPWRIHFFYKSLKITWAVTFIICFLSNPSEPHTSKVHIHPAFCLKLFLPDWCLGSSSTVKQNRISSWRWRVYTFIMLSYLLVNCLTEAFCCFSVSYVANMILRGNSPWLRTFHSIPLFYFTVTKLKFQNV